MTLSQALQWPQTRGNVQRLDGSQWIGVPGEIRGYEQAHRLYGKLPWATLFKPTIQLAREGFPIPQVQGRYLPYIDTNETQSLRKLFSDKNGNLLKTGDIVKFEKLADTLEIIANHGADAFYTGRIAEDLIRDIQEAGGTLTTQDLAAYRVTVTDAWVVPLGEYKMYIPPPPAGGIILSLILNIMKGYHLNSASLVGEQKTRTYHHYVEAFKFANGLKKHIHDPQFGSDEMAKKFTEDSFANHIRSLISSDKTHDPQYYNITPYLDSMGTTHVSVLAEDGSAVSVTSTINHIFGSKVFSPRTGVILNNELSDFCGRVDNIFPGEQPPSSMAPAVLKSQSKTLVIGSTGGSMITTGIASALMNHLWFGKSLKEAIAAPVVYVDSQNAVKFEPAFDKDVIEDLKALGHKRETAKHFYNVVNAVEKEGGCICAVSDARKLGKAAGY
ncbi:gamma-glutamyltransferase 5a isoform X2 [Siniperca chuatsi]|uniref:gamma-glutamyltransferase 5a isoform X2 n=1 Tax=Siniperca chuatsi TaxID=119488 RepID=UPI001CE166DB|nr:gamma-glutamyltransferase 5a isoform X2 [Siniperca chuatsi]